MKNYKLIMIFSLLLLFLTKTIFAQTKLELKVGFIRSNISTEAANTYQSKSGKLLAFTLVNPLNSYFSFKNTFSYLEYGYNSQENESYQFNYYSVSGKFSIHINQIIAIPIENFSADFLIGPNLLFTLNTEHKTAINSYVIWRSIMDVGILFGLQLSYRSFLFEINYNRCLTNINSDETSGSNYNHNFLSSEKNKAWQFLVGYSFHLK